MTNKAFVTIGPIQFDILVDPLDSANNVGPTAYVTAYVVNLASSNTPIASTFGNPDYGPGPTYALDVSIVNADTVAGIEARVVAVVREFYADPSLAVLLIDSKGLL